MAINSLLLAFGLLSIGQLIIGEATGYFQRPDSSGRPQLLVAIYCGGGGNSQVPADALYHNQYLDVESRKWRSDRDSGAICTQDKQEILNYCKKVYPKHDIRNIVESSRQYKIDNWCRVGSSKRRCRTKLHVRPYRCLEGTFQSDALLVPERCLFNHVHNKTLCENSDSWSRTAGENCHQKSMKLQSYAMLQPCGLDLFSGVEFVCCPSSQQQTPAAASSAAAAAVAESPKKSQESNSFAQAANGASGWPKVPKYDNTEDNLIKTDEQAKHADDNSQEEKNDESAENEGDDDDDDEYEEDEDEFDDDSSSVEGDKSQSQGSSTTSTTTTSTTTTTTTTTTERPVDHYLSHFDLAHEHDEFRQAELAVEASYRDKIAHVMKEWAQHEERYEEMKKRDPQAAEKFKQDMTHQFEKIIKVLEEEGAAQRHQLASMHAERAMAIINRRKKAAMDCLTQALDRMPIRTKQVERCIAKLLRALEKDRAHTLRQYKNLLNINTREALREKKIILDHLVTLNRAANQSIAMLDRSPLLVEKLKNKTIALWHRLRQVPLSEPIVKESELKTMERFEEEVAQRKIEQERQRLVEQEAVQDAPQEAPRAPKISSDLPASPATKGDDSTSSKQVPSSSSSSSISSQAAASGRDTIEQQQANNNNNNNNKQDQFTTSTTARPDQVRLLAATRTDGHSEELENEIHYQIESAKYSHLKADAGSNHELSSSLISIINDREPIVGPLRHLNLRHSAVLLVSACTVVIVLALIGFRYYSKHSTRAYRRQGFAEVGRSCPEEKSVTNLQFNGYENPAYKFFEAEA